jgi:hypothetical protein
MLFGDRALKPARHLARLDGYGEVGTPDAAFVM